MSNETIDIKETITYIEETIKCTIQSLNEISISNTGMSYIKSMASTILHIDSSINILKATKNNITSQLLEHLKNDK